MCGPAGDAGHHEDRGEELDVEAQDVVRGASREVQVRLDLDGGVLVHGLGHLLVHLHPLLLAVVLGQLAEGSLHGRNTGVTVLVHAVTEAHDELLVLELVQRPLLCLGRVTDLQEVLHHGLVSTTVQRALEGADGGGDGGVGIRHRGGHHAGGEGGGVEGVLGVEDEGLIKGLNIGARQGRRAFLLTEDHPQEVLREALLAGRLDVALAAATADVERDDARQLRHELQRGAANVLGILGVLLRILRADEGDCGAQNVHRVARLRHGGDQVNEVAVQVAQRLLTSGETNQLILGRQLAVPQQVSNLLEGAVACQLLDRVAAVGQGVGLRDNLGHGGLIDDNAVQTLADFWGFRHGVFSFYWVLV